MPDLYLLEFRDACTPRFWGPVGLMAVWFPQL